MLKAPVFILGCHKSGTSLLRNLLDGHPSLFVIPTESHFFQNTGHWVDYYFRRTPPANLTFPEIKENLFNTIDSFNNRLDEVGDSFTKGKWNMDILRETLYSEHVTSLKDLSHLYVKSLYKSLFNKEYNSNLIWVEKSVENTEFALEWLQLYPDAKFIYILRNPYANLTAIKKFRKVTKSNSFPIKGALLSMHNSYYFLYKNLNFLSPAKFKVLKYEDLLEHPETIMKDISNFIGISYCQTLLQPTLLGELWSGNSSYGNKFTKISNENVNRWERNITKSEIFLVNKLFTHVLKDYEYEVINTANKNRGKAIKSGKLKEIFLNKILSYYLPTFKSKT
jgi:protein-tyrosine sulfotransferase